MATVEPNWDATDTDKRTDEPTGHSIVMEERSRNLVVQIPELGGRELAKHRFLILLVLGLTAFIAILVSGLLLDHVQGSTSAGWVMVGVLVVFLIGICIAVVARLTKSGAIHVTEDKLRFHEWNAFGDHHASWHLDSLRKISVGVKVDNSSEGLASTYFLEVQPSGSERLWFSNRTKNELDWIATRIHDHLEERTLTAG